MQQLIGTHDIQNISVSSPLPGTVRVIGDFIQGSTATGLLVIIYSQSDDCDIQYVNSKYSGQSVDITVAGLTSGPYRVSVFVLENGVPFSRVATLPQTVYMDTLTQQGMPLILYFNVYLMQIMVLYVCYMNFLYRNIRKNPRDGNRV